MLTSGLERWPEPRDVTVNSNNSNHSTGLGEHGQELPNLNTSTTSTPSTIDDNMNSPTESMSTGDSEPDYPASPYAYVPADGREFQQFPRQHSQQQWQPQEEQEAYAQRRAMEMLGNFGRHHHLGQPGQLQNVPNLITLSCAVCASPTVQMCEGCSSVGYCSREHQIKVSTALDVCGIEFNGAFRIGPSITKTATQRIVHQLLRGHHPLIRRTL